MPLRFEARGAFKAPGSEVRECDCEEESKKDHRKVRGACLSTKKKNKENSKTQTKKPRLSNTLQKNSSREKTQQLSPPPPTQKNSPLSLPLSTAKRERAKNEKKGAAKPRA
jgi:hypothetical protein